jgi:hypothetical protein
LASALLLSASACAATDQTSPESALIAVRLRNDAGASAGRNRVIVTPTNTNTDGQEASVDGSGEFTVSGAGTYLVRVIPRAGLLASAQLRVTVFLTPGERVRIDFTLYREGKNIEDQPAIVTPW